MDPDGDAPASLRSKLWGAVAQSKAIRTKEMKESCAFYDCVRKDARKLRPEVVIDVCGGHGALALLFLAHGQAEEAMIIDQLQPSSHGWLCEAWAPFVMQKKISYDQRPLQQALPEVLKSTSKRMLVVACHACQHLARQIMDHCMAAAIAFAVCPCCPKDPTIQATAKALAVDFPKAMILAEIGRLTSQHCVCALRLFDEKVSPHHRVIFGRPGGLPQGTEAAASDGPSAHHGAEAIRWNGCEPGSGPHGP